MTNKKIITGLVALAFVAGTMMTGTMAYADHKSSHQSNAGGVPGLQAQVDKFDGHVTVLKGQVDSFFDVFFDIDVSTGERNTPDSFFDIFIDAGEERIDSFFDVFTELNATDEDLQAQIVALEERLAALENPEPEPTCQDCVDAFDEAKAICFTIEDRDEQSACLQAAGEAEDACYAQFTDEELELCADS